MKSSPGRSLKDDASKLAVLCAFAVVGTAGCVPQQQTQSAEAAESEMQDSAEDYCSSKFSGDEGVNALLRDAVVAIYTVDDAIDGLAPSPKDLLLADYKFGDVLRIAPDNPVETTVADEFSDTSVGDTASISDMGAPGWTCGTKVSYAPKYSGPIFCNKSNPCPKLAGKSEYCVGGMCKYGPKDCASNMDCADDELCTIDECLADSSSPGKKTCSHNPCGCASDCEVNPNVCTANSSNSCVNAYCDVAGCGECMVELTPGCCSTDSDCGDGDACTADYCEKMQCKHMAGCCG